MPEKRTLERARRDREQGKSASTQASEFVREEIDHVREGKHGARSTKQAIAIGLSKARRAGVKLAEPEPFPSALHHAIAGHPPGPDQGGPERGFERSTFSSGPRSGGEAAEGRPVAGCAAGRRHTGASRDGPAAPGSLILSG